MKLSRLEACARAAHEQNNVFCLSVGDSPSPAWEDLTDAQRAGVIHGAEHVLAGGSHASSHELWMQSRLAEGWTLGPVKDFEKRTSPNLVPYADLPFTQQIKDDLFAKTVRTMDATLEAVDALAPMLAQQKAAAGER